MTTASTQINPDTRAARAEGIVQIIIMLAIGGAAGAASFTHVHNVAAAHGQGGWLAWADAVVLELMSIASGLEMRRRKRLYKPVRFPAAVLGCAVALSISAQVVEAELSIIGWISAALPALGFLVMVKIALGRTASSQPGRESSGPPGPDTSRSDQVGQTRGTVLAVDDDQLDSPNSASPRPGGVPPAKDIGTGGNGRRPLSEHPVDPTEIADVAHLLPAATAAHGMLARQGRPLTHKALTQRLRADGQPISNARAAILMKILKSSNAGQNQDREPART